MAGKIYLIGPKTLNPILKNKEINKSWYVLASTVYMNVIYLFKYLSPIKQHLILK